MTIYLEEDEFAGCCGIKILWDFPELYHMDKDERDEIIADVLSDLSISKTIDGSSKFRVVALTDEQLHEGWHHVIRKAGYRRVARFTNTTGNIVNVYFGLDEGNNPPPYKGKGKKR